MDVPPQDVITRVNVVVYVRVTASNRSVIEVKNHPGRERAWGDSRGRRVLLGINPAPSGPRNQRADKLKRCVAEMLTSPCGPPVLAAG